MLSNSDEWSEWIESGLAKVGRLIDEPSAGILASVKVRYQYLKALVCLSDTVLSTSALLYLLIPNCPSINHS